MSENPLESLSNFSNNFKKAEKKYENVSELAHVVIEHKNVNNKIAELEEEFKSLVKEKISLDNPRNKINKEIAISMVELENMKKQYAEEVLNSVVKEKGLIQKLKEKLSILLGSEGNNADETKPDFEFQIVLLEQKIKLLEQSLEDLESKEININLNLDPADGNMTNLKIEKQVLENKIQENLKLSQN